MLIREASPSDAGLVANLVAESNRDVAERFGLTADNCPKHPSQCTESWVRADLARGERYFIAGDGPQPIGCVAYEQARADLAYLNRLSVLPGWRRQGVGERLVRHVIDRARADAVAAVSLGVIGEHLELQRWYRKLGFIDGETRTYAHLPFAVKYMSYPLAAPATHATAIIGSDAPHSHGD
jgi:ribosomal protein S18 acetylase RimI-like enzyme